MEIKYINCPKCGTRNFADDKVCGICKAKLTSSTAYAKVPESNNNPQEQKRNLVLIIIVAAIFIGFVYYNVVFKKVPTKETSTTSYNNPLFNYQILEIGANNKSIFNVKVRIYNKLTDEQLKLVAQRVIQDISVVSNRGIVFFYLPEYNLERDGAWATADFDPEVSIRYFGQSIADEQSVKSALSNIKDYVGLWTSNKMSEDIIIRIRKDAKGNYFFENISSTDFNPSPFAHPLRKTIKNGKTVFIETESSGYYYVIEPNGNLSIYFDGKYEDTYQKLK